MIGKVLDMLFGCHHRRITRPITPVHKHNSQSTGTYVACLECGKQFYYDTGKMRVGAQIPMSPSPPSYSPDNSHSLPQSRFRSA